jgi:general stress protein 26
MKLHPQPTDELARLGALIDDMPVAMMTTQDASGDLVSRPMTTLEMDETGALWFFTDLRSSKLEQLAAVNLSFADAGNAKYVSMSGHGQTLVDPVRIQDLWSPFAKPWFPDGPGSPTLALLKFVPTAAEFWDAPSSRMVRLLAMAASMVSGKPPALGDHDSFDNLGVAANAAPAVDPHATWPPAPAPAPRTPSRPDGR